MFRKEYNPVRPTLLPKDWPQSGKQFFSLRINLLHWFAVAPMKSERTTVAGRNRPTASCLQQLSLYTLYHRIISFLTSGLQIHLVALFTSQALPVFHHCERSAAISLPLHEIASADFVSLAMTE
jgi:hypothetical protein